MLAKSFQHEVGCRHSHCKSSLSRSAHIRSCASENAVFDEAYRQFFQNLPQSQRNLYAPTATPQDVLDGLEKLQIITQCQKRRGLTVFARVQLLHDRLKPYFETMGVFIQSNPKCAALIWGSFRLVLEVRTLQVLSKFWHTHHAKSVYS